MTIDDGAAPTGDGPDPEAGGVGDDLAWPIDFTARYGAGLRLGLSLGGGGVFFVAWQIAYLHELRAHGIELDGADRVVGTSAGSLVASVLEADHLSRIYRELSVLAKVPKLIAALAPAGDLQPSQLRAVELFRAAADAAPATIREIGHAALAAQAPAASVMARNVGLLLGTRRWPSAQTHLTCVDAFTGERCVITKAARVGVGRAAAASSAVPGLFAPQPIGDRRCMDGGVSGTGLHLDVLAGSEKVVALALSDGSDVRQPMMTSAPGSTEREIAALRASGSALFLRTPAAVDVAQLMDPAAVPEAIETGRHQAVADVDELRTFLS